MIIIQKEFIKLEINIPCNEIRDFLIEVASKLNSISKTNNTEPNQIIVNKNIDKELLTVSDIARKLKVNTDSVYRLIKTGNLLALKLGSLKVTSTELERFINSSVGKDFSDLNNVKDLEFHK